MPTRSRKSISTNKLGTLATVKKLLGLERSHFEIMKGSLAQNEEYCSKQSSLTQYGLCPVEPGGRQDKNLMFKMLEDGAKPLELMQHDFGKYCRFQRGITEYYGMKKPVRTEPLKVFVCYGAPGCGKTKWANITYPDHYRLPIGKFWFTPSLCNANEVLIDDFKSNLSLVDLLQLTDEYPIEVERKGGHMWFCPDVIIITTNKSPYHWYEYNDRDMEREALFRRITTCYKFEKNEEKEPRPVEVDIFDHTNFNLQKDAISYRWRHDRQAFHEYDNNKKMFI